jgi:hypothetical protein
MSYNKCNTNKMLLHQSHKLHSASVKISPSYVDRDKDRGTDLSTDNFEYSPTAKFTVNESHTVGTGEMRKAGPVEEEIEYIIISDDEAAGAAPPPPTARATPADEMIKVIYLTDEE